MPANRPPKDGEGTSLDEAALHALSREYAVAADRGDVERFLSVFTDDGALTVPGPPVRTLRGHDELSVVPGLLSRYHRTFHLVGQGTYRPTGAGSAAGEVYCVAHHLERGSDDAPEVGSDKVMYICYLDEYIFGGSGWRIGHRTLDLRWTDHHSVSISARPRPTEAR